MVSVQVLPAGLFVVFITPRLEKLREVRAGRKEAAINCLHKFICDRCKEKTNSSRSLFGKKW